MPKDRKNKVQKRANRRRSKTSRSVVLTKKESNEDAGLSSYATKLQLLSKQIKQSGALHVNSETLKKKVRDLVKLFFQTIRVDLKQQNLDTTVLDTEMQSLLSFANSRTKVTAYNTALSTIEQIFRALESEQYIAESNKLVEVRNASEGLAVAGQDKKIIEVLSKIIPSIAISYQQILEDIAHPRLSYKGTAAELREVLREVLDYLAPDSEVVLSSGFKLEKDRTTPTMKQKVRFILKNRHKSKSAIEAPENATEIVEESIAKLARATYNRGSLSTHSATERTEVINLKRYLDSILCEILEIY